MNNIILVGMSGIGKTTLGKNMAQKLKCDFLDMDEYIEENEGMSVKDIFYCRGEKYFRKIEEKKLKYIVNLKGIVIATGGGVVENNINCKVLKTHQKVIYLQGSVDTIYSNILKDDEEKRPLLNVSNPKKEISRLLDRRDCKYRDVSNYIVDVDGKPIKLLVDQIIGLL